MAGGSFPAFVEQVRLIDHPSGQGWKVRPRSNLCGRLGRRCFALPSRRHGFAAVARDEQEGDEQGRFHACSGLLIITEGGPDVRGALPASHGSLELSRVN